MIRIGDRAYRTHAPISTYGFYIASSFLLLMLAPLSCVSFSCSASTCGFYIAPSSLLLIPMLTPEIDMPLRAPYPHLPLPRSLLLGHRRQVPGTDVAEPSTAAPGRETRHRAAACSRGSRKVRPAAVGQQARESHPRPHVDQHGTHEQRPPQGRLNCPSTSSSSCCRRRCCISASGATSRRRTTSSPPRKIVHTSGPSVRGGSSSRTLS